MINPFEAPRYTFCTATILATLIFSMVTLSGADDAAFAMVVVLAFLLGGFTFLWIYRWTYPYRTQSSRSLDGTFAHALMKLVKTHPEVKVELTGDWQCSNRELIIEALSFNRFYHGVQSCRTIENDSLKVRLVYAALLQHKHDPCRSGVLLSTLTDIFVSSLNDNCTLSLEEEGRVTTCSKLKLE
jgi:hypothetical protein